MFDKLKNLFKGDTDADAEEAEAEARTMEVGWLLDKHEATLIYGAPERYRPSYPPSQNAKATNNCPGILDYEARYVQVNCPYDIHLRLGKNKDGQPELTNMLGIRGGLTPEKVSYLTRLLPASAWRHPQRPVVQIDSAYRFVTDEPLYINVLPPQFHYRKNQLPGLVIGGRFPLHLWPRHLVWAFEWFDTSTDLILKRGEPWFSVRFESSDPSRHVKLVEAEMTPELNEYIEGLDHVSDYMNQTYSLFKVAKERRPEKLLKKKQR